MGQVMWAGHVGRPCGHWLKLLRGLAQHSQIRQSIRLKARIKMKIVVVGAGYVGLSNAVLLAQHNEVVVLDVIAKKIELINRKQSPIYDQDITQYLQNKHINLRATSDKASAYSGAGFVLIAVSTNQDAVSGDLDTNLIEAVVTDAISIAPDAVIVIKSTVPVGYTAKLQARLQSETLLFSPEFLREGRALYDNLYPSRIVIGEAMQTQQEPSHHAKRFAALMQQGAIKSDIPILFTGSTEAEAIKLFSNAYLAMRVAYFNELDSYAATHALDTRQIIDGVCLDPRVGSNYNNPSFGFGGYCLPKDTRQLLNDYKLIPQALFAAVVDSNKRRKDFVASEILKLRPKTVGMYRLISKAGSDNFRASSSKSILQRIKSQGVEVIVYEPLIEQHEFLQARVVNDLSKFKLESDVIVANRVTNELADVANKVYSRDIFRSD